MILVNSHRLKLAIPSDCMGEHICLTKRVTKLLIIPSTSSGLLLTDRRFFNEATEKTFKNFRMDKHASFSPLNFFILSIC